MQHRLVAEHVLGRYLTGLEVVHHEDENPSNNNPRNLWLFPSQADHVAHHQRKRALRYDPKLAARLRPLAADSKVSLREAAHRLDVAIETVRALLAASGTLWQSAAQRELSAKSVRAALQGRSTKEAADLLGVNHQTLRNRFPHLISKRASPGFLDAYRAEIRNLAKRVRAEELSRRYRCSPETVKQAIRRWAKAAPDAWSDVLAFQRSRLGMRRSRGRKA